ncbi:MAG TPA: aminopeptidase N, partial [Desulforhopalus sp.]|nr:aminopeptidase N [Desulforhopalus sp.]
MQHNQTAITHRLDYRPFAYAVISLDLCFQLHEGRTEVHATTVYHRKPQEDPGEVPLVLDGEGLELLLIKIDGHELAADRYQLQAHSLVLIDPPEKFRLEVVTAIHPEKNTALEGLYRTGGNYCSQCEAHGFRKITFYPDRPDVLTRFTTRIEAERSSCPVMLANGNLVDAGLLTDGRHFAVWEDPYPKPCYLFALVAGRLVALEDEFVTRSGRIVALKIFVEEHNRDKCGHAMASLQKAMRWDEEVFGLEYDLDIYMIVAVDDFNMGAMENKGLNIFNAKYVLASPETATDEDYLGIEGVIAHEYFHNWTGNRVTCRDWFQLSLKEGLTVFRDQEFSADMNSRPVQRIEDVRLLKNFQFREDAGPLAHPVRPDAYLQINNFYTATVYNKGAEVIRMMHTLLGPKAFRQGMDLYFSRHDGQAVTCDDFVAAMADASGVSLEHFSLWYSQAGTPVLSVTEEWREEESEYRLRLRQNCPDTPGQSGKKPFHMPVAVGLLDGEGNELLQDEPGGTRILELTEQEQLFTFHNIAQRPVLSFLRDFSAPVRVAPFQKRWDLAQLMRHDTNLYNRWDSAQRLASEIIIDNAAKIACQIAPECDQLYLQAVSHSLSGVIADPALLALTVQLPGETT